MTRPVVRNGFGLSAAEAEREVRAIEACMSFLPDSEAAIYRQLGITGDTDFDRRTAKAGAFPRDRVFACPVKIVASR